MTLFSLDRKTGDRAKPTVKLGDEVSSPMAHQTVSTSYKPSGTAGNTARVQMANEHIYVYDINNNKVADIGVSSTGLVSFSQFDSSGNMTILIGQAPDDGRTGIWVGNPGVDVYTELGG